MSVSAYLNLSFKNLCKQKPLKLLMSLAVLMACATLLAQPVRFIEPTDVQDTGATQNAQGLSLENFADAFQGKRWAYGPEAVIRFDLAASKDLALELAFYVPQANQRVALSLNGVELAVLSDLEQYRFSFHTLTFTGQSGRNELKLVFADWNGNKETFAAQDARLMAVELSEFRLQDNASFAASQGRFNAVCKERLAEYERIFSAGDIFFYPDEMLNPWLGIEMAQYAEVIGLMKDLQQALATRGTNLVVLPIPPRNLLWESKFVGLDYSNYETVLSKQSDYQAALITGLQEEGILTLDVDKYLHDAPEGLLFKQDIHWTPEGARLIAAALSGVISQTPEHANLEKTAYRNVQTGSRERYVSEQPVVAMLQQLCDINQKTEALNLYTVSENTGFSVDVLGLDKIETYDPVRRWGLGPESTFSFELTQAQTLQLDLRIFNSLEKQSLKILLDAQPLKTLNFDTPLTFYDERLELNLSAGKHSLNFAYGLWNKGATQFAPADSRPLALEFQKLTLTGDTLTYEILNPTEPDSEAANAVSLFGDAASPEVVLVGSSFSQDVLNFAGFLQESLSLEVLNVSVPGGGTFSGIKDYLLDDAFLDHAPSYLIWEFPAYGVVDTWQGEFSHLIASSYGVCPSPTISYNLNFVQGQAQVKAINTVGNPLYAYIRITDPTVTNLDLTISYTDGSEKTLKINHGERMSHKGEFFAILENPESLKDIALSSNAQGSASLALCALPSTR